MNKELKITKPDGANQVFGGEDYLDLPAITRQEIYDEAATTRVPTIETWWELTEEQLELLNKSKIIRVKVLGERPQPIMLHVKDVESE